MVDSIFWVGQSQEGSEHCQPITGGKKVVLANHRRGGSGVSQSQEGREMCQPITGGEGAVSAHPQESRGRCFTFISKLPLYLYSLNLSSLYRH
jgi:hypothetical protein